MSASFTSHQQTKGSASFMRSLDCSHCTNRLRRRAFSSRASSFFNSFFQTSAIPFFWLGEAQKTMILSVIVVFLHLSCTYGENPAVQILLTNKGLQYGKHAGTGWIEEKLEQITFPDISGEINIRIGTIHYTLSGVTVKKCDLPEPDIEFVQNKGVKTSIAGLNIALTGEWRTRYFGIHDGGSFDMAIFDTDVTSVVQLGSDDQGHLSVTNIDCGASVRDVRLYFYGGASWIFQPFVKYFKGHIITMIQSRICPELQQATLELDHHLQAMNVSFGVNEVLTFDVPLTDPPVIDASNLKLGFKGEFYSIKTHKEPPFVAQQFTLPEQAGYMLSVGISEFTLNSASFGYFSAGELQALINDSMIPPYSPIRLNTSSMGVFIPKLSQLFPGLLMNLYVYAREAPEFSLQPDSGNLSVKVLVKAVAIEPNGTQVPLFDLNIDSNLTGKMMIAQGKLMGSVVLNNITLALASSEIGVFKTDALEKAVKIAMTLVLSKLNVILQKGIILPRMKHAQLVNTVLKMQKGFVAIYSDVETLQTDRSSYL